jgi:hypothetical protein
MRFSWQVKDRYKTLSDVKDWVRSNTLLRLNNAS